MFLANFKRLPIWTVNSAHDICGREVHRDARSKLRTKKYGTDGTATGTNRRNGSTYIFD